MLSTVRRNASLGFLISPINSRSIGALSKYSLRLFSMPSEILNNEDRPAMASAPFATAVTLFADKTSAFIPAEVASDLNKSLMCCSACCSAAPGGNDVFLF